METFRAAMAQIRCGTEAIIQKAKGKAGFGEHELDQLDVTGLQTIYATAKAAYEARLAREGAA